MYTATSKPLCRGRPAPCDERTSTYGDSLAVDLHLSRQIIKGWEAFFGVENLFDRTYEVGKTADGIVTIGAPVLIHGGIRGRF